MTANEVTTTPEVDEELGLSKETVPPEAKPDEKETPEEIKKRARKPPSDGPCKRCGQNKPINRLMLCYPCWVKTRNEERGWKEGQPHPAGCNCDVECAIDRGTFGN